MPAPMFRRKLTPPNMTKEEVAALRAEWDKLHIGLDTPTNMRLFSMVRTSPWWRFWNVEYERIYE